MAEEEIFVRLVNTCSCDFEHFFYNVLKMLDLYQGCHKKMFTVHNFSWHLKYL